MEKIYSISDVVEQKRRTIPDFVFKAFNNLLVENFNADGIDVIYIKEDSLIEKMIELSEKPITREYIINNNLLKVSIFFAKNGWHVSKGFYKDKGANYFSFRSNSI